MPKDFLQGVSLTPTFEALMVKFGGKIGTLYQMLKNAFKKHPLQNRTNVQIKGGGGSKAFWTMFKKTALFLMVGFPYDPFQRRQNRPAMPTLPTAFSLRESAMVVVAKNYELLCYGCKARHQMNRLDGLGFFAKMFGCWKMLTFNLSKFASPALGFWCLMVRITRRSLAHSLTFHPACWKTSSK